MNQTNNSQKKISGQSYIYELDSLAEILKVIADQEEEKEKQSKDLLDALGNKTKDSA